MAKFMIKVGENACIDEEINNEPQVGTKASRQL